MMLQHKRILITGSAGGLGKAFAEAALQQGAYVGLIDHNVSLLEETVTELKALYPERVAFAAADVSDAASVKASIMTIHSQLGVIDGLVNNAALATNVGGMLMEDISPDLWERVLKVNVVGLWMVTTAVLPHLKTSGQGKIVNIASDTALWGAPCLMSYVASKGAVLAMTKSMARELGEYNICVNVVAPGLVKTESTQYVPQARHDFYEKGRALSRAQYPTDVTGAVMFLLSDHASFVTGQTLPINGGFVFA